MRELSEQDKRIIDRIIVASEAYDLQSLQVARLLREELSVFALEWEMTPKKISIYAQRKNSEPDFDQINSTYFNVSEFLYLIVELANEGYVKLQSANSTKIESYPKQLFDREKYQKKGKTYVERGGDGTLFLIQADYSQYYLDVVDILDSLAYKIVFPLQSLKEFKERSYLTQEQLFRREEVSSTSKSANSSKWAAWEAAIATFCTIITSISNYFKPTDITDDDINKIEKAIYSSHSIQIENLNQIPRDTMTIVNCPRITISTK